MFLSSSPVSLSFLLLLTPSWDHWTPDLIHAVHILYPSAHSTFYVWIWSYGPFYVLTSIWSQALALRDLEILGTPKWEAKI